MADEIEIWGVLQCVSERADQNGDVFVKIKGKKFVIGRSQDCDLQVSQKWVSGHHCYIQHDSDGPITLHDTSSNGTFINKKIKITSGQSHELKDGDTIHLALHKNNPSIDIHYLFKTPSQEPDSSTGQNLTQELEEDLIFASETSEPKVKKPRIASPEAVGSPPADGSVDNSEAKPANSDTTSVLPITLDKMKAEAAAGSLKRDPLEDALLCGFCLAILHDPVSLQPCLHCFCAGCYSSWMKESRTCPQCRKKVKRLGKNYVLNNTIEAFLKQFPHKQRSREELELLDAQNKITSDMLNLPMDHHSHKDVIADANEEIDDGESYYSDDDIPTFPSPYVPPPPATVCRQCPHYQQTHISPTLASTSQSGQDQATSDKGISSSNLAEPSSCSESLQGAATFPPPYVCSPFQRHIRCNCCWEPMPDRHQGHHANPDIPPQECSVCRRSFCHMYWRCQKQGCYGCLNKFADIAFGNKCMKGIINENATESTILEDYLKSKDKSWRNLLEECLEKLTQGTYECSIPLTTSSILCYSCGLKYFRELAYQYRCDIPLDELPARAANRADCYWGRNCRTQKHKESHADRFNHICEQTRFV